MTYSNQNLRYSYFSHMNLEGEDFSGSDLTGCFFNGAITAGANFKNAIGIAQICPTGSFTAWKKCRGNIIAELVIPGEAARSNGPHRLTGTQCRAEFAFVADLFEKKKDETIKHLTARSIYFPDFEYNVGEMVYCHLWDENPLHDVTGGIHFFLDIEQALAFKI